MTRLVVLPMLTLLMASTIGCRKPERSRSKRAAKISTTVPTKAPRKETALNLLYWTPSVVAVSSAVRNRRIFPDHLIDGRAETAWNSRTGDLVGSFVAFRIPRDAKVRWVGLTAGFDRRNGDVDLFTANHRIVRVRMSRDGVTLAEHRLQTESRTLQRLSVDAPGGDYRLEVLEVLPGTKSAWREVVVSELVVAGIPGRARHTRPTKPPVYVGTLDAAASRSAVDPVDAATGVDSFEAHCDAYTAEVKDELANQEEYPGPIDGPYCTWESLSATGEAHATVRAVAIVTQKTARAAETRLAFHEEKGVVVTDTVVEIDDYSNPGCAGYCKQARVDDGHWGIDGKGRRVFRIDVEEHCMSHPFPGEDIEGDNTYVKRRVVCEFPLVAPCRVEDVAKFQTPYHDVFELGAIPWEQSNAKAP